MKTLNPSTKILKITNYIIKKYLIITISNIIVFIIEHSDRIKGQNVYINFSNNTIILLPSNLLQGIIVL